MKLYKKLSIALISAASLSLASCEKWLLEPNPGVQKLEDFFASGETAIQVVNGAYVPLMWEYNSTYFPEWFIGDVVSDDALKGGQGITDMQPVYDLENFKTQANNELLLQFYRAQYQGVARCNVALQQIPEIEPDAVMDQRTKDRLIGEIKFLRAMYYFRLVRIFGGVPKIDFVVESSSQWKQPKATATEIYEMIINDLKDAESKLWKKREYTSEDLGRATKGAAQAMLLKAYLSVHNYPDAEIWGKMMIDDAEAGEYRLVDNYKDNFTLAGENGPESVFEIQYMEDPTSDYGEGFGFSRGTFVLKLTRSRSSLLGGGWGFNKPTQNLYNEYEVSDPRRDITILNPTDDEIQNPEAEIYLESSRYINRKYAMMDDGPGGTIYPLAHDSRGSINNKVIRYADVLLMYAEACVENSNEGQAKWALEKVRERARHGNTGILPAFPNYLGYADNNDDLRKAIRHERRVELAMEGHRWFDITRWGEAKEIMDAYKQTENASATLHMAEFIKGKHELFPIPEQEVNLGSLGQ
jgi:hypothetical protein